MVRKFVPEEEKMYIIDRSACIEKGFSMFPSLFIAGAAATGKTIVVRTYLKHHPETDGFIWDMREAAEQTEVFLREFAETVSDRDSCFIFENMPEKLPEVVIKEICRRIREHRSWERFIMISREYPESEMLELSWKRLMKFIYPKELFFTKEEVRHLVIEMKCPLSPKDIYDFSGGWPGCTDQLLLLGDVLKRDSHIAFDMRRLSHHYPIFRYIEHEIYESLSAEEKEIVQISAAVPWISRDLLTEIFGTEKPDDVTEKLFVKGILTKKGLNGKYYLANVLSFPVTKEQKKAIYNARTEKFWRNVGAWYEDRGFIEEALCIYKETVSQEEDRDFAVRNFQRTAFILQPDEKISSWKGKSLPFSFIRGIHYLESGNFELYQKETQELKNQMMKSRNIADENAEYRLAAEIYLNMQFLSPEIKTEDWVSELCELTPDFKIRIYSYLGTAVTPVMGHRNMADFFACTKREENYYRKTLFEHVANIGDMYYLAQAEYLYETMRTDQINENISAIFQVDRPDDDPEITLTKLTFLYQRNLRQRDVSPERFRHLEKCLEDSPRRNITANSEALHLLFGIFNKEEEQAIEWLQHDRDYEYVSIDSSNFMVLFIRIRAFMALGQYAKAEQLLKRLIPYLKKYRYTRLLIEALFQRAVVLWALGDSTQALKACIESMLLNEKYRFAGFYLIYGGAALGVLEAYDEWKSQTSPTTWTRKKKYNYGSILRMPEADFIEYLIRILRKNTNRQKAESVGRKELLTLSELSVLNAAAEGCTNEEICRRLNLKLATVKSHLYSIYKKLEVSNRGKAIQKAQMMGILQK